MRRATVLVLCWLIFAGQPGLAQVDPQSFDTTDFHLQELEKQFFQHTYVMETLDERLNRLENFVAGSVTTGSPSERLAHLEQIVSAVKKQDADLCLENSRSRLETGAPSAPHMEPEPGSAVEPEPGSAVEPE